MDGTTHHRVHRVDPELGLAKEHVGISPALLDTARLTKGISPALPAALGQTLQISIDLQTSIVVPLSIVDPLSIYIYIYIPAVTKECFLVFIFEIF